MFNIVLFEPEIPPNTGNIIRLCANTGAVLHLIKPLGFSMENKQLRRAGLDYHNLSQVKEYDNLEQFMQMFPNNRIFALTTKGSTVYSDIEFQKGDVFLFGPETRGLSQQLLNNFEDNRKLVIPQKEGARSLNLSNAVSIMIYEAWRQNNFAID